jgi:hypothetical protein
MTQTVRDARPPAAVLRVLNPVMRAVLRSPVGRAVTPLALLEFDGRRSHRRYRVVAGWHPTDDGPVVFTPAGWRTNLRDGVPVVVRQRGRRRSMIADLVTDPAAVAVALNSVLGRGTSPRMVGLTIPVGHRLDVDDVMAVNRAMICFREAGPMPLPAQSDS